MKGELIDISASLVEGMTLWPGDPALRVERVLDVTGGDPCTVTRFEMGSHTGTHVDAPFHYLRDGVTLQDMPLDALIGPCRVVEIPGEGKVPVAELLRVDPRPGERLLLKTPNSLRRRDREPFDGRHVCLGSEGAQFLAERKIRALGIDALSVGDDGPDGERTHRLLLEAGVWILEGLHLGHVAQGDYELLCLPLKGPGNDGAPARAVLRTP